MTRPKRPKVLDTRPADGYRGIWYACQPSGDEYRYKYSGGLGTYPQQIAPFARYCAEVNRTFFCYGGCPAGKRRLLHVVSYYDHDSRTVPRPAVLLYKKTDDAHDNPAISVGDGGHIWIFSNAHGRARPSYIHRSVDPYSLEAFQRVAVTNFSYGQPWHLAGSGFLLLHTRYSEQGHRRLFWTSSPDGREWEEPRLLAHTEKGHYQVSWPQGGKVGTAFNYHPEPVGLDARTNLYYLETTDGGATWRTAGGEAVSPPLTEPENPALVHDYRAEGLLVYLKNVRYDRQGRPVLLYLTSPGYQSGPANDPRIWRTARWTGSDWEVRRITRSDHNYDYGQLHLEADGGWRLIAPTETGPQPYNPGGEVALWTSDDRGASWRLTRRVTEHSRLNHTYLRRPLGARPDFYALWADGNPREPSVSRLYFTDRDGSAVRRLPTSMKKDKAEPIAE